MLGHLLNGKAKRAAVGISAVLVLAGLLAVPQVRALASEFLSIFRVEQFVLVSVDEARLERIREAMKNNMGFEEGDENPPIEPTVVGSVAEAASLAGFNPLTSDLEVELVQVSAASSETFTPNVDEIRAVYSALDLDPNLIPDNIDGQPFDVSFNPGIGIEYEGEFYTGQMLNPTVNVPDGVDMKVLGKAWLMLLGMSEAEATTMSESIDWATTLVMPIPSGDTTVQEVTVRGKMGLLMVSEDEGPDHMAVVVWQENGYIVIASGRSSVEVLAFAEGLK